MNCYSQQDKKQNLEMLLITICQLVYKNFYSSKITWSIRLLGSLLKTGLPIIKNVIKPLAERVFIPLELTAAASGADAGIHKKILGSGITTLIISNEKVNDIMKIVQALEDCNILLKGVTKTIKNETKEQKGGFLSMLLGTLGASLLGHILTGKGIVRAGSGNTKEKGILRANSGHPSYDNKKRKRNCKS